MKIFTPRFIAQTAILLALCLIVQQFKTMSQFVTGPLVNAILILAVLQAGLASGLIISILSPLMAFIISPSPIMQIVPQLIPLVMLGNSAIVVAVYLLLKKNVIVGMALGSVIKPLLLWAGLSFVILPIFGGELMPPQRMALSAMFSYNQLITAVAGSVIAYFANIPLKKVLS